jgi:hypothetical protein
MIPMLRQGPVLLRDGFPFVTFGILNFFFHSRLESASAILYQATGYILVKQWRMLRLEIIAAWRVHV